LRGGAFMSLRTDLSNSGLTLAHLSISEQEQYSVAQTIRE
jgi:hypothetical protein